MQYSQRLGVACAHVKPLSFRHRRNTIPRTTERLPWQKQCELVALPRRAFNPLDRRHFVPLPGAVDPFSTIPGLTETNFQHGANGLRRHHAVHEAPTAATAAAEQAKPSKALDGILVCSCSILLCMVIPFFSCSCSTLLFGLQGGPGT